MSFEKAGGHWSFLAFEIIHSTLEGGLVAKLGTIMPLIRL